MKEKLLTVAEAAMRLTCSQAIVYKLVGAGRIACHRVGLGRGTIRFSESQIAAYLTGNEQQPREETILPPLPTKFKHLRV